MDSAPIDFPQEEVNIIPWGDENLNLYKVSGLPYLLMVNEDDNVSLVATLDDADLLQPITFGARIWANMHRINIIDNLV